MLKREKVAVFEKTLNAAAFGRLCVETTIRIRSGGIFKAAAFGRLCVETL